MGRSWSRWSRVARWAPRRTVRLRLTLVYGALFLLSGAGLLAIVYFLLAHSGPDFRIEHGPLARAGLRGVAGGPVAAMPWTGGRGAVAGRGASGGSTGATVIAGQVRGCLPGIGRVPTTAQLRRCLAYSRAVARAQHAAELRHLLTESGVALAIMTVASLGLGWLVAGRVLRPLRTITAATRSISASSLHSRLALQGPDDELKELGDTVDGLLGRLEAAFTAQRQFVANASHELRTPLARQRTLLEVALADPEPSVAALQGACRRVLSTGTQQERLIEGLLTLARSQRGLDRREPVELGEVADEVVIAWKERAERYGVTLRASLRPARMMGDAVLAERLVANLVDNAVRHNMAGGTVDVAVLTAGGRCLVSVANTGPLIAAGEVERLLLPFQRGGAERAGRSEGLGLGLSIVSAIASAHGARLSATAQPSGGLWVRADFPQALPPDGPGPGGSAAPTVRR